MLMRSPQCAGAMGRLVPAGCVYTRASMRRTRPVVPQGLWAPGHGPQPPPPQGLRGAGR
jgi:hypothetical protein